MARPTLIGCGRAGGTLPDASRPAAPIRGFLCNRHASRDESPLARGAAPIAQFVPFPDLPQARRMPARDAAIAQIAARRGRPDRPGKDGRARTRPPKIMRATLCGGGPA